MQQRRVASNASDQPIVDPSIDTPFALEEPETEWEAGGRYASNRDIVAMFGITPFSNDKEQERDEARAYLRASIMRARTRRHTIRLSLLLGCISPGFKAHRR